MHYHCRSPCTVSLLQYQSVGIGNISHLEIGYYRSEPGHFAYNTHTCRQYQWVPHLHSIQVGGSFLSDIKGGIPVCYIHGQDQSCILFHVTPPFVSTLKSMLF